MRGKNDMQKSIVQQKGVTKIRYEKPPYWVGQWFHVVIR